MSTIRHQPTEHQVEVDRELSLRTLMDVIGLLEIAMDEASDAQFKVDYQDACDVTGRNWRLVALIRQAQAGAHSCLLRMEARHA